MKQKPTYSREEGFLGAVLFFLSAFLFAPATLWLVEKTIYYDQIMHAFIILGFAGVYLMMENREKLRLVLRFGNLASGLLVLSFILLAINTLVHSWFFILLSYCLGIAAWVIFVFGQRLARVVLALLSAFCGYVALALVQPFFDWPLRMISGKFVTQLLIWLGHQVELGITPVNSPQLIMIVDGKAFEVASECNGFGMISGAILLSLLLVFYRRILISNKILAIVLSVLIGTLFNISRILVICLLAPYVPEYYHVMHEVVGSVFFWGALIMVWWMVHELGVEKKRPGQSGKSIVFFDGECFMCNKSMRFLMRIDKRKLLWFAPLQGTTARDEIFNHTEMAPDLKTIVYVENAGGDEAEVFVRSTAVLKAMERTGWLLGMAGWLLLIPAFVRDLLYRFIAVNRIRWFGRTEMCSLIPPEQRKRLLP